MTRTRAARTVCRAVWAILLTQPLTGGEGVDPTDGRRWFSHHEHVPALWLRSEEVERDCLGCHERGERSPGIREGVCGDCHYGGFADNLEERPPARETVSLAAGELRSFLHRDHVDRLECGACHGARDAVPDDLPVPVESGHCMECHDPEVAGEDRAGSGRSGERLAARRGRSSAETADVLARFLDRLNSARNPSMGVREAPFRHADHVVEWRSPPAAEGEGACAACHATTWTSAGIRSEDATFDLSSKTFDTATCSGCHVLAPEEGLAPEGRSFSMASLPESPISVTAGTFSHADHDFRAVGGAPRPLKAEYRGDANLRAGKAALEEKECFACHEPDESARGAYVLRGGADPYGACMPCHEAWRVEAFGGRPHRELVRDTSECERCHVMGFVTDMKARRPAIRVRRTYLASVRIRKQRHPFITKSGERSGATAGNEEIAECGRCHLARLEELASRLEARTTFFHAVHLPAGERSGESHCQRCHAGIERTQGPDRITESAHLFSGKACAECHVGSELRVEPAAEPTAVTRPAFSHADHYIAREDGTSVGKPRDGASGTPLECEDCHDGALETSSERSIGTRPTALSCTPCHNHRTATAVTGDISQAAVESCQRCHRHGVPSGRESREWRPLGGAPRRRIAGIGAAPPREGDRQFHPHPRERTCGECHPVRKRFEETPPAAVWGESAVSRAEAFHREFPFPRTGREPTDCLCCHWAQQHSASYACDAGAPDVRALRAVRGGVGEGFPGRGCGSCP